MKTTSQNKFYSVVFEESISTDIATNTHTQLALLYRKDNSVLDCFCRYDVYLSYLFISRRNILYFYLFLNNNKKYFSSCTGILTCFLFSNQEYIKNNVIFPFWPIWTCFKIDLLNAKFYCIENLPHIGCQSSHLTNCYYHQDLY